MKWLMISGALHGFLSIALGAFGAHALRGKLAELPDGAKRLENWQLAATYQLSHAVAILASAWLCAQIASTGSKVGIYGGAALSLGTLIFSGSLYLYSLTGIRAFGAITPIGGTALLVGWGLLIAAAAKL